MKEEKVDKGFELIYFNLSYRRKFIRTLWLIPWMILILCFMYWQGFSLVKLLLFTVIFTVACIIQALYNYKKWKVEMKKN